MKKKIIFRILAILLGIYLGLIIGRQLDKFINYKVTENQAPSSYSEQKDYMGREASESADNNSSFEKKIEELRKLNTPTRRF